MIQIRFDTQIHLCSLFLTDAQYRTRNPHVAQRFQSWNASHQPGGHHGGSQQRYNQVYKHRQPAPHHQRGGANDHVSNNWVHPTWRQHGGNQAGKEHHRKQYPRQQPKEKKTTPQKVNHFIPLQVSVKSVSE